ncbi:MAG: archaemetzincin family Zn-dependent metalloprotease [Methanotrichaceae archaeon]|nr:archaemetzincin family Zn-dependent metalloprotease [Methanotrichaceae archaeon]
MIYIQPIGPADPEIMRFLQMSLNSIWPTELLAPVDFPYDAYDKDRHQYRGSSLLKCLWIKGDATLAVTEADAYVEGLNFIFGLAVGRRALISLKRLRPDFYGLSADEELFKLRALKEAVHEIGHVFGLDHCPNRRCVMHFSNSISDTDLKDYRYCRSCEKKIMENPV